MFERTVSLIGEDNFKKLQQSRVLIVGLGGVGGYIFEALLRSGIGTIGICDFDVVDDTNRNRQILALAGTVGMKKTESALLRASEINNNAKIVTYDFRLSDPADLQLETWDFVADAIDDVDAKVRLIAACPEKIISSMGTGNKLDPFSFKIESIDRTHDDPLARSVRKKLREAGINKVPVLYSPEKPQVTDFECIPSISYMPAVAGFEIASFIIKKLLAL